MEQWVKKDGEFPVGACRAVCRNHTLDMTQLSKAMTSGGGWSWQRCCLR